jgi:hypothetical protein
LISRHALGSLWTGPFFFLFFDTVSQKVFMQSFCRSQLPQKYVNLTFTTTNSLTPKQVDIRLVEGPVPYEPPPFFASYGFFNLEHQGPDVLIFF